MKKLRFYIALWFGKLLAIAIRLLGRAGTQLPGHIALKICPDFLAHIQQPATVIAVTGTNGKTTVANILVDAYEELGTRVLSNRQGSNLNAGVASCMLIDATLSGKTRSELAVLEIDERSSRLIYPHIAPNFLICTNLFRDSVGRNAHPDYIAFVINSALPEHTHLILCADDLISANLGGSENPRTYYGIEPQRGELERRNSLSRDIAVCPKCGATLFWDFVRYHHIGRAHCPKCDFASPEVGYLVLGFDAAHSELHLRMPAAGVDSSGDRQDGSVEQGASLEQSFKLLNDSLFNIYNQAAAIAAMHEAGVSEKQLQQAFANIGIAESRFNEENVAGTRLVMQLAKGQNAIACSRAFDYIVRQSGRKALVLNLDDYFDAQGGSENITWLYDCDYEYLNDPSIVQIVIGGVRSLDQYLRLLIAGVPAEKMLHTPNELDSAELIELAGLDAIYILYDVYTVDRTIKVKQRLAQRLMAEAQSTGKAKTGAKGEEV